LADLIDPTIHDLRIERAKVIARRAQRKYDRAAKAGTDSIPEDDLDELSTDATVKALEVQILEAGGDL
jgi:hypothetical protein